MISRKAALLFLAVIIAGCGGIKPWTPPNHREDGPTKGGLLTGPEGAWTIGIGGKVDDPVKKTEPSKPPLPVNSPEKSAKP